MKLRSCLTLFAEVEGVNGAVSTALKKYFGGEPDEMTAKLLEKSGGNV